MRKTPVVALVVLICGSACFGYTSFNLRRCTPAKVQLELPAQSVDQLSEADMVVWPTVTRATCSSKNTASAGKECRTTRRAFLMIQQHDVVCDDGNCGVEITIPVRNRLARTRVCRSS